MVCVDLVVQFSIRTPAKTHSLLALTMIDPATGWFEIVEATNKSATSIQDLFHSTWLARYPRTQFIVFDNGISGKFKREFKKMCDNYGIKAKPTTSHNNQSTSKCNHWASTQSFQWHAQIIWLGKKKYNHENLDQQENYPFDYFLQSTAWLQCY
jgi:hypothetical protein